MRLFNKYTKGEYEYAKYNRLKLIIYTLGMYSLSAAIYIIGYITTKTNKNLLTIVAVLGILPASKLLISLIMACRVKTVSMDIKKEIDSNIGGLTGFYNMYFTSYDVNYYLNHCVITSDSFIGYTDTNDFDNKKFQEHIEKHMKIDGISNVLIKIFDSKDGYINRLSQLNNTDQVNKTNEKMIELINNISL